MEVSHLAVLLSLAILAAVGCLAWALIERGRSSRLALELQNEVLGALAPEQRSQLAKFGIRAMLAGTMANLMSASIVGIFS